MEVNSVNAGVNVNTYNTTNYTNTATAEEDTNAVVAASAEETDVYEKSTEKTYKPDYNKIQEMIKESEAQVEGFRKLVQSLFNKQSQKNSLAGGVAGNKTDGTNPWAGTRWENDVMIEIDDETRLAAQKDIEEGGYYSVDETAKRLLNFAVALSGGDPSKIETLKGAVEKGFKAAADMWGGELPEISQKTYDAVMKGFDEWETSGNASDITLLNQQ